MPVPLSGPGSVNDPFILKGQEAKCPNPKCGSDEELWQNQMIPGQQHFKMVDGEIEWGSTEMNYEFDEAPKDEPQYICRACDHYFEAPELFDVEDKEEKTSA